MPPQNIQILLPVWGERYTRDFLDLCLPSLMAPGNIPALSRLGRCTFVLLAPARDTATVERHGLWALLRQHCSVSVIPIDDLVSQSGSTVLTLAYVLAIRTSGSRALDTCFVPLVADYVLSDGSLLAVVSQVFKGARAVLAGNFQISRERAMPRLQKRKGPDGVLAIHARDLVDLSLNCLHEVTLNDVVLGDQPVRSAANRFFWPVDDSCMVGRFYLMHMIALHPETADFVISAPSDYSLVPELCPSGTITRMTDSDDYFVVECQPEDASAGNADRVPQRSFARSLAVWATAMQHNNAQHALIFHSEPKSSRLGEVLALSEQFVARVEAARGAPPLSFRDHPLWPRSLDHHVKTALVEQDPARLSAITGDAWIMRRVGKAAYLRSKLLGSPPHFRPWHPRWKDIVVLKRCVANVTGSVAIISNAPARVRAWFDEMAKSGRAKSFTHIPPRGAVNFADGQIATFDSIICYLDRSPCDLSDHLAQLAPLLRSGGTIILAIGDAFSESEQKPGPIASDVRSLLEAAPNGLVPGSMIGVSTGKWGNAVQGAMMRYARKSVHSGVFGAIYWLALAAGLAAPSVFFNVVAIRWRRPISGAGLSSLLLQFRKSETGSDGGSDAEERVQPRKRRVWDIGRRGQ